MAKKTKEQLIKSASKELERAIRMCRRHGQAMHESDVAAMESFAESCLDTMLRRGEIEQYHIKAKLDEYGTPYLDVCIAPQYALQYIDMQIKLPEKMEIPLPS